jgi:uncharacterized membrane protein
MKHLMSLDQSFFRRMMYGWILLTLSYAQTANLETEIGYAEGKILELSSTGAKVQLDDQSIIQAQLGVSDIDSETTSFKVGQQVELYYSPSIDNVRSYVVIDWIRRPRLVWLAGLFLLSVFVVAGLKGLRAFFATLCSLVSIIWLMLPRMLEGWSPILISLLGIGGILLLAIYFVHGINWSTTAALIGTYTAIIITLLLGLVFSEWAYLTGFGSEEAMMLSFSASQLDLKGLLMAGLLISTIGALTDITIVQASVIRELSFLNPQLGLWGLYKHGMNVGYDHVGSLVNTLVLAYTGTALPLLLMLRLNDFNLQRALNLEMVAAEMIHTLIASIGLILAVPLTTLVAALLFRGNIFRITLSELGKGH